VRILLLEDSDLDAELIEGELRASGLQYVLRREQDGPGFEAALREFAPRVVLSDYRLPSYDGGQALALARQLCPEVPVIVISGAVGEEKTVELLKGGATDFVLKDRLGRLGAAVSRALGEVAEREALRRAQAELYTCNMELEQRVRDRTRELREKNELMEEELRMAHELQQALLPRHFPPVPLGVAEEQSAVRVCSLYRASHFVGGDCFNVTRVSDTALSVFICDVMGHGVRAALVTAMLRALEEQLGEKAADPALLLSEMNHALCHIFEEAETLVFASACALTVDVANGRVTFANAGHPSPLLVRRAKGRVDSLGGAVCAGAHAPSSLYPAGVKMRSARGPALGIFSEAEYSNESCEVEAGDVVLLFTDGLFEVENARGELFNESGLREAIARFAKLAPEALIRAAVEAAEKFASGRPFPDDMCVVGLEITRLEPAEDSAPAAGRPSRENGRRNGVKEASGVRRL
jgi:serine phosphatase RsbU (regulator of sigma subunit)/CheY-like chemotaxis protein